MLGQVMIAHFKTSQKYLMIQQREFCHLCKISLQNLRLTNFDKPLMFAVELGKLV